MNVDDPFHCMNQQVRPMQHQKLQALSWVFAFNKQSNTDRYLCLIPNSVFGPHDNFDPESGHVLSSLISRFHRAREIQEEHYYSVGHG